MAGSMDDIRLLAEDIGARPASTEEEYFAASNLEKRFRSHGLQTGLDEFSVPTFANLGYGIAYAVIGLLGILSQLNDVVRIIAAIVTLIIAVIVILERLGRPIVLTASRNGRSQNVIGRHPAQSPLTGSAPKPVIIVAHYDSGRGSLLSHPAIARYGNIIRYVVDATVILVPFLLILSIIGALPDALTTVLNVLLVIASVPLLLVGASIVASHFTMPYTSGANDNASGVAAMLGVLERVRPTDGSGRDATDMAGHPEGGGDDSDAPKRMRRGAAIAREVGVVSAATLVEYIKREIPITPPDEDDEEAADWYVDDATADAPADPDPTSVTPAFPEGADPDATNVDLTAPQAIEPPDHAGYRFQIPHVTDLVDGTEQFAAIDVPAEPDLPVMHPAEAPVGEKDGEEETGQTAMFDALDDAEPAEEPDVPEAELPRMFEEADKAFEEERIRKEAERAETERPVKRSRFADLPVDYKRPEPEPQPVPAPAAPTPTPIVTAAPGPAPAEPIVEPDVADEAIDPTEVVEPVEEAEAAASTVEPEAPAAPEAPAIQEPLSADRTLFMDPIPSPDSVDELESPDVDEDWGTTQFSPREHLKLLDVPDPSVAAVDPYSVSNVQPVGTLDPNDFSSEDFHTGTFATVGPAREDDDLELDVPDDSFFSRMSDRIGGLFGGGKSEKARPSRASTRSRRSRKPEEESLGDWLDLEEGFDAKSAGRDIGTWDNFEDGPKRRAEDDIDPDEWRGGGTANKVYRRGESADDEPAPESSIREAIFKLGDSDIVDKEIWFVATGAGEAERAGMADFLERYDRELSGCTIINLECVGAGELSVLTSEGRGIPTPVDRRLLTLARRSGRNISVRMGESALVDRDTDASIARARGYRAMTLMGLAGGAPVNSRWTSDTIEAIEPQSIDDTVEVVLEIIRRL